MLIFLTYQYLLFFYKHYKNINIYNLHFHQKTYFIFKILYIHSQFFLIDYLFFFYINFKLILHQSPYKIKYNRKQKYLLFVLFIIKISIHMVYIIKHIHLYYQIEYLVHFQNLLFIIRNHLLNLLHFHFNNINISYYLHFHFRFHLIYLQILLIYKNHLNFLNCLIHLN